MHANVIAMAVHNHQAQVKRRREKKYRYITCHVRRLARWTRPIIHVYRNAYGHWDRVHDDLRREMLAIFYFCQYDEREGQQE